MPAFRHKPTPVEAILFDGTNGPEVVRWSGREGKVVAFGDGSTTDAVRFDSPDAGTRWVDQFCWLVRHPDGRLETLDLDQFDAAYEPAEGSDP